MKNEEAYKRLCYYFDNNKKVHIGTNLKLKDGNYIFYNGYIIFLKDDHLWMHDYVVGDIMVKYEDIYLISEYEEKEDE